MDYYTKYCNELLLIPSKNLIKNFYYIVLKVIDKSIFIPYTYINNF